MNKRSTDDKFKAPDMSDARDLGTKTKIFLSKITQRTKKRKNAKESNIQHNILPYVLIALSLVLFVIYIYLSYTQ